ncbi:MAG: hypothetical protein O9327_04985 [Polaromonas sp.]|nr:hypothetical protein [Polaromonas sp.]
MTTPMIGFGAPLHKVQEGRIFVRQAVEVASSYESPSKRPASDYAEARIVVGVVAVPKRAELERLHQARINGSLWIDANTASVTHGNHYPLLDCPIANVLTAIQHRRHLLSDSLDLYVRETMLTHTDPNLRWVFIGGIAPVKLEATPVDGLWEIGTKGDGLAQVSTETFNGEALSSIFRKPIWGPGGRYGFSTDLEAKTYEAWIAQERARNMAREPEFAAFVQAMEAAMPLQMVFDAETYDRCERVSKQVLQQILEDRRATAESGVLVANPEATGIAVRPKPR